MKYISLKFDGQLQSYGTSEKINVFTTDDCPTKSAVTGMGFNGAELFGEQVENLGKLKDCKFTSISFRKTGMDGNSHENVHKLKDFQIARVFSSNERDFYRNVVKNTVFRDGTKNVDKPRVTYRYYHQDKTFCSIMEVPDDLAEQLKEGFDSPKHPIFLGRKCCIPAKRVFIGMFDNEDDAEKAIAESMTGFEEEFRIVDSNGNDPFAWQVCDVPIRFGKNKKYASRSVIRIEKCKGA